MGLSPQEYRAFVSELITRSDFADLTAHGFGTFPTPQRSAKELEAQYARDREDLFTDRSVDDFNRAVRFLGECLPPLRTARRFSSYGLKHVVEGWSEHVLNCPNGYLTNGVFIVAAVWVAFPLRRIGEGPNAWVGISARAIDRMSHRIRDAQRVKWNQEHLESAGAG